jgi:hypothetical protein
LGSSAEARSEAHVAVNKPMHNMTSPKRDRRLRRFDSP